MKIERFIIVYNADAGLLGELRYLAAKLTGSNECAACSITHNTLSEKKSWQACKQGLGIPVDQLHRNEVSQAMREVIAARYPCVLAQGQGEFRFLLGPDQLEALDGQEERFADALQAALQTQGAS